MDPASALGLAASIASLGSGIVKTLQCLNQFRKRYKEASFTVSLLIGQLSTIKAALDQVTEWVTSSLFHAPRHQQLVKDLDMALEGCKVLILLLETNIDRLGQSQSGSLNAWSTVQHLWDEATMNQYLSQLGYQVNALNLLLTAFQCRSVSKQQELLERNESRSTIAKVADSSSSLQLLKDIDSSYIRGRSVSEDGAALDVNFDFDHEILRSKAYERALVSFMRHAVRQAISADQRPGVSTNSEQASIAEIDVAETCGADALSESPREETLASNDEISLVFTEVENSSYFWERAPVSMRQAIQTHNQTMQRELQLVGGWEVKKRQSDGFIFAFPSAASALLWCLRVQEYLVSSVWPEAIVNDIQGQEVLDSNGNCCFRGLDVKMGIHWGRPIRVPNPVTHRMDYIGPVVKIAAYITELAGGGQTVGSQDFVTQLSQELEDGERQTEDPRDGGTSSTIQVPGSRVTEGPSKEDLFSIMRLLSAMAFQVKDLGPLDIEGKGNMYLFYSHSLIGRTIYQARPDQAPESWQIRKPDSVVEFRKEATSIGDWYMR